MLVPKKRGKFKKGSFKKGTSIKVAAMIIGLVLLAAITPASHIFAAEKEPFKGSAERKAELANDKTIVNAMPNAGSKTLVIYFSRSGNTERMAKEIATYKQATLVHLDATDYRPGLSGLVNAVKDSRSKHAAITPENLDLSPYQTIFIGSPIWWYSPAPPVWQFVHNHDFADKNVVLFTTFNSSFRAKYIDEFQAQIKDKGGYFIKHIYVERGRMIRQINLETLLEKTREELDKLQL